VNRRGPVLQNAVQGGGNVFLVGLACQEGSRAAAVLRQFAREERVRRRIDAEDADPALVGTHRLALGEPQYPPGVAHLGVGQNQDVPRHLAAAALLPERLFERNT